MAEEGTNNDGGEENTAPKPSRRTPAPELTPEQEAALEKASNMSEKIRYLYDERLSTAQIRSVLDIRYQFVRNVIIRYREKIKEARQKKGE